MAEALAAAEQVARLAAAVAGGAVLGLNRNLRGKAAGVRTHALVSLGAALVTCGAWLVSGPDAATRVMQGVITGIGFIGAGVILHLDPRGVAAEPPAPAPAAEVPDADAASEVHAPPRRRAEVRGLTTAATVWVAAAIGVACALGLWALATAATLLTLLVLTAGGPLEAAVRRRLLGKRAAAARRRAAGRGAGRGVTGGGRA
jgi:putative Mg2+ transporter-C (MgtC) family protein